MENNIEDYRLTGDQLERKYSPDGNGEHPRYTRQNWRVAVWGWCTLRGYWDWVQAQLEEAHHEASA